MLRCSLDPNHYRTVTETRLLRPLSEPHRGGLHRRDIIALRIGLVPSKRGLADVSFNDTLPRVLLHLPVLLPPTSNVPEPRPLSSTLGWR